jgi:ribosome-binding factor A
MPERRQERVAHLVQVELARVLLREAKDPRLREVTVTAVRMTADLRLARVYVRMLGGAAAREPALRALARATPFLRGAIGHALGMRVVPELRFEYDATPDTAERVDELLGEAARTRRDEDEPA